MTFPGEAEVPALRAGTSVAEPTNRHIAGTEQTAMNVCTESSTFSVPVVFEGQQNVIVLPVASVDEAILTFCACRSDWAACFEVLNAQVQEHEALLQCIWSLERQEHQRMTNDGFVEARE